MTVKRITAGVLDVVYMELGDPAGWPCILGHGFPYDAHAYDEAGALLAAEGARVIVPWLRGYGGTRFLSDATPRSGEQAVLAADMLALADALGIDRAVYAGYDWGGRAACIIAALWPNRVSALVSGNSYNIQNIARAMEPSPAAAEATNWYQYYFHCERGRRGLEADRRDIARTLWKMWSPTWDFDEETFERSATAFDNPDFVEVVIHSYRHRYGLVPGDPAVADIEARIAGQPPISVPTIRIDGETDSVGRSTEHHGAKFTGPCDYRTFADAGHNLPQEKPADWVRAVLDARRLAGEG